MSSAIRGTEAHPASGKSAAAAHFPGSSPRESPTPLATAAAALPPPKQT